METKVLPSDMIALGLTRYPIATIPPFIAGGNIYYTKTVDGYAVSPIGALAAGLGLSHDWAAEDIDQEVQNYLAEWNTELGFSSTFEADNLYNFCVQASAWKGKSYDVETLRLTLFDIESKRGYRDEEQEEEEADLGNQKVPPPYVPQRGDPQPAMPEHDKLRALGGKNEIIGDFIEWIARQNVQFCEYREAGNNGEPRWIPATAQEYKDDWDNRISTNVRICSRDGEKAYEKLNIAYESWGEGFVTVTMRPQEWIARYFGIDEDALNKEKDVFLQWWRVQQGYV